MAKSQDAKKNVKKEPLKTAKEKAAEKREKKNSPKRDQLISLMLNHFNKSESSFLYFVILK